MLNFLFFSLTLHSWQIEIFISSHKKISYFNDCEKFLATVAMLHVYHFRSATILYCLMHFMTKRNGRCDKFNWEVKKLSRNVLNSHTDWESCYKTCTSDGLILYQQKNYFIRQVRKSHCQRCNISNPKRENYNTFNKLF